MLALSAAWIISFYLRFPDSHLLEVVEPHLSFVPVWITFQIFSFVLFRRYSSIWRFSGLKDLEQLVKASLFGVLLIASVIYFIPTYNLPRSVLMIVFMLTVLFNGGLSIIIRKVVSPLTHSRKTSNVRQRILIYGAGQAGELLMRNILQTPQVGWDVVGFIDDDPRKRGKFIHLKPIFGDRSQVPFIVKNFNINIILFSIPSLSGKEIREILYSLRSMLDKSIEIKIIPGLADMAEGKFSLSEIRNIEISDLLRRKPVSLNKEPVKRLLEGSRVLVVGGGGSIGSELCRQIAAYAPESLVVVDKSEYGVYELERTLKQKHPTLFLRCIVADAKDRELLNLIFQEYLPQIVFNAAAYKHVPLMEFNPQSALINNVTIVHNLKGLCSKFGVERHILISTDKAVRPSSVMGATKRICELLMLIESDGSSTRNIAVRFGNVLGSTGSVINLFQEQIQAGGPVTVTHPEMKRYFMLTSEAVELVLQAAAIGKDKNIFVLDMGEPILIKDLAYQMIDLCGLKPGVDIKIDYIGLRPGEKLSEVLYYEGEETATEIPNLLILNNRVKVEKSYEYKVLDLLKKVYSLSSKDLKLALKELAPEYEPDLNPEDTESALSFYIPPDIQTQKQVVLK